MSASLQTTLALTLVLLAAGWLVWRKMKKGAKPGCGQDCACPKPELKFRKP